MTTRRERVILDLEDNLSAGLARNAVAATVLDKALNDLGGTSTKAGKDLDKTGESAERTGKRTRDAAPDIDRFSGRLKVLRDVAILLGPTIAPLGAATIPLLTGSLLAMGAAAGGIGASVLAIKGLGDGLKALDAYQLEPTAENLQALRIEMEKLGPAGAHFVKYLDSIESELKTLQTAAREGLLPGLEKGIDAALTRLPGVRKVIREMAEGVGELAETAGRDLAPGGDWDNFLRYLDTDGKRAVVTFGEAIGDIANGLADMLVAFAPLNRNFADGFSGMAEAFAQWAAGLGENDDFQDFIDYIRTNGPRAIDMLGELVTALAGIVEAAAPIGAVTLPIITKFLDLIGKLASSPLGGPFLAAVVGITAYSRAMDLATKSQDAFAKSKATGLLASPWPVAVVAALTVAVVGLSEAYGKAEEMSARWADAIEDGSFKMKDARAEIAAMEDDIRSDSLSEWVQNVFDPDVWAHNVDSVLGMSTEVDDLKNNLWQLRQEAKGHPAMWDLLGNSIGLTGDQLRVATGDAEAFTGALAELNGWLDKRQALRDYRASVRELSRTIRNGFTRQDLLNLDDIGRNIAQVASQIKDKDLRDSFLEKAQRQLEKIAQNGGPKAREEVGKVLAKLADLGLVTAEPKIKADKKEFDKGEAAVRKDMQQLDRLFSKTTIDANDDPFQLVTRGVFATLNRIPKRVDVTIAAHRIVDAGVGMVNDVIGGTGNDVNTGGGFDPRRGFGRGSADLGGITGAAKADLFNETLRVSQGLRGLRGELAKAERAVEKERRQRDALLSSMSEVRGSVRNNLSGSLFDTSGDVWSAGAGFDPFSAIKDRKDQARRMLAAIKKLKKAGIIGAALQEIIGEGLEALEFMAAQPAATLATFASDYNAAAAAVNQAANYGANAAYGAALSEQTAQLQAAVAVLHQIKQAIKHADKNNRDGHDKAADRIGRTINGAARGGIRLAHARGAA